MVVSRRSMLAAVGVMPIAAYPAAAVCRPEQDDSELIAAVAEWRSARSAYQETERVYRDKDEQYDLAEPDRPAALHIRKTDCKVLGEVFHHPYWRVGTPIPQVMIDSMARCPMKRPVSGHRLTKFEPDPVAQRRADEIVAACNGWQADKRALRDFIGLSESRYRNDEARAAHDTALQRVIDMPARTMAGAAAKAQGALFWLSTMDQEECLRGDPHDIEIDILLSIVRDVAALGGQI